MHGGPGADHWTMLPFRRCADRFTLIFYDDRCNGRSQGAPISSMTWENVTADEGGAVHPALDQRLAL
jgi:proline iminopeptidase